MCQGLIVRRGGSKESQAQCPILNILKDLYLKRDRLILGFPGGSDDRESTCQKGRLGFDPWVGKIHWRREGLPTPVPRAGSTRESEAESENFALMNLARSLH